MRYHFYTYQTGKSKGLKIPNVIDKGDDKSVHLGKACNKFCEIIWIRQIQNHKEPSI